MSAQRSKDRWLTFDTFKLGSRAAVEIPRRIGRRIYGKAAGRLARRMFG